MFEHQGNFVMNSWQLSAPSILMVLGLIVLVCCYWLICREIIRRRQAEINLWKQSERERVINQIAQQIRRSLNLDDILSTTVSEVRDFLDCDRVLIYRLEEDGRGNAITETVLFPYPAILDQTFPEEVFPKEYHQAYTQGKNRTISNVEEDDLKECLADFVKQFGVQAKLVVPIIQESRQVSPTT